MTGRDSLSAGLALLKSGDIDQAIELLERAVQESPRDWRGFNYLGVARSTKGDHVSAVEAFQSALQLQPNSATIHYNVGLAYEGAGHFDLAERSYREAFRLDPSHTGAPKALQALLARPKPTLASMRQFADTVVTPPPPPAPTGPEITLCDGCVTIRPSEHQVADPMRAKHTFGEESRNMGAQWLMGAVAALIILPLIGLVLYSVDASVQGDPFPGITYAICCWLATPLIVIATAVKGAILIANRPTRVLSPENCALSFYSAVEDKLWKRAFNCLTDQAQVSIPDRMPRASKLQQLMPTIVRFSSPETLGHFWEGIGFMVLFDREGVRTEAVDRDTANVFVKVTAAPLAADAIDDDGESVESLGHFEAQFVVVRRRGYWFVANGFIWPP